MFIFRINKNVKLHFDAVANAHAHNASHTYIYLLLKI